MHDQAYLNENDWRIKEANQLGLKAPVPVDDVGPDKVRLYRHNQLRTILFDSLVMCQFLPYNLSQLNDLMTSVTGWDITIDELLTISERAVTTFRVINLREGLSAEDDRLPERYYQPKTDGALADKPLDPVKMNEAKYTYYSLMGWDSETGIPKPDKLEELGIS
ncbi:aldehyde ferredoxin oxidoreductase C-terminal domain-containing protein [Chloroflexota bacterium]